MDEKESRESKVARLRANGPALFVDVLRLLELLPLLSLADVNVAVIGTSCSLWRPQALLLSLCSESMLLMLLMYRQLPALICKL